MEVVDLLGAKEQLYPVSLMEQVASIMGQREWSLLCRPHL